MAADRKKKQPTPKAANRKRKQPTPKTAVPEAPCQPAPDAAYITADEFAALARVQPQTAALWRIRGNGPPFIRLHGRRGKVLYSRSRVAEWLAGREYASTSAETVAAERA
jgi:hypothetical protein